MRSGLLALLAPLGLLGGLAVLASLLAVGILQVLGDVLPLAKLISKMTLVFLLLSVWPLRKILHFSWQDFGFVRPGRFFRQLGFGLGLGILTLLPVLLTLYALDVQVWDHSRVWTFGKISSKVGLSLLLASLIAVGEELLFRGLLLSSLRRYMPMMLASVLSALYYAALHFLKTQTDLPYAQQEWSSGLVLLGQAFANWLNPDILPALMGLWMVGLFLAVLRTRIPDSLGICMGCHAGWVWQIKVSKDFFNLNPQADHLYLVSQYDGVVGPLVTVWLGLALVVWWWLGRRPTKTPKL